MESNIYHINKEIESFLINTYRRRNFNRDHIFYNVLEILKHEVGESSRLNVIYIFSEVEKAVSLLKGKSAFASIQISKVDMLYEELDQSMKNYMGVSYHPMKALEYYNSKNFEKSIEELDRFFRKSYEVLKNNKELFVHASTEQYLNLFRIFADKLDYDIIIDMTCDLLLFCYYNIVPQDSRFKFISLKIEDVSNNEDVIYWKVYITNCLFKKLITLNKEDVMERIINRLYRYYCINSFHDDYLKNSIMSMFYFYKKEYEISISSFRESLKFPHEYSEILQYINLRNIGFIFNSKIEKHEKELQVFNKIYQDFVEMKLKNLLIVKETVLE